MRSSDRLSISRPLAPHPADKAQAEFFMRRAIELGRQGVVAGDGGPFGAVVVKGGQIVGEGWNRVIASKDPTAHGEIVAIREACEKLDCFSLEGGELYTTGEPCPMCLAAIYWARIDRIYYGFSIQDATAIGFDDDKFYQEIARPWQERLLPSFQILREEALLVAEEFLALPERVKY